jgi:hypothetical protein
MPPVGPRTHLRIRIEPKLLDRLEAAREKGGQTLTGEITRRLTQSFAREDQAAVADIVREVFSEVKSLSDQLIGVREDLQKMQAELQRIRWWIDDQTAADRSGSAADEGEQK